LIDPYPHPHSQIFLFIESNSDEIQTLSCPDFSQYLYFLFAPTLIYCDKYPRNAVIHWDYVLQMFGQVCAAILYVYYVVVRFCVPTFANLNQNQITLPIFISVLFNSIMPGSLFLLLGKANRSLDLENWSFFFPIGFYGFLHCWLNAFAEMLRFADRMFYKVKKIVFKKKIKKIFRLGLVEFNIICCLLSNMECCCS
jgi:sterol O-acyltransferase